MAGLCSSAEEGVELGSEEGNMGGEGQTRGASAGVARHENRLAVGKEPNRPVAAVEGSAAGGEEMAKDEPREQPVAVGVLAVVADRGVVTKLGEAGTVDLGEAGTVEI